MKIAWSSSTYVAGSLLLNFAQSQEILSLRGRTSIPSFSSEEISTRTQLHVERKLQTAAKPKPDYCSSPKLNWCHPNAMCIPNPNTFLSYECRCSTEDGLKGDGFRDCQGYNECETGENTCASFDKGGTCEDRNRTDADYPMYKCGCREGWKEGTTFNEHGPTECVRMNECAEGIDKCHADAMCLDKTDGYDCVCNVGYQGDGFTCTMSPPLARAKETDLGLRFSKVRYSVPVPPNAVLPLTPDKFPITNATLEWLKYSDVHSVAVPGTCAECDIDTRELINAIGGEPDHPSSDESSPYWADLEHVVDVQYLRHANVTPSDIMPLPRLWKNFTIQQVADAVHDEYPGIHHVSLIQHMDSGGVNALGFKVNNDAIPFTCRVEFIREVVMLADMVTWAIARVSPLNFAVKWTVGRIRPEEAAYMIYKDQIPVGPPQALRAKIKNLPWPEDRAPVFTAYTGGGSPRHPSWPAMHSAGSASSLWMPVVLDLTPAEFCQVKLTDWAVSYARTVAGVHYTTDNIAGLNLGQEIVARRLPGWLKEKYGSDEAKVQARIDAVRFDWNDFLDSDCAKGLE